MLNPRIVRVVLKHQRQPLLRRLVSFMASVQTPPEAEFRAVIVALGDGLVAEVLGAQALNAVVSGRLELAWRRAQNLRRVLVLDRAAETDSRVQLH